MSNKTKFLCIRLFAVVLGMAIVTFGVASFYASGLGSDPASLLIDGVHRSFGVSHGVASWLIMAVLLVVMLPFGRKFIGVGTVLNALLMGFFINMYQNTLGVFNWVNDDTSLVVRVALMALGVVALGTGLGVYISANLGAGPLDIPVLTFSERLKKPIFLVRLVLDFIFAVVGFALDGVLGIGTIVGVVFTGFIIQFVLQKSKNILKRFAPPAEAGK